MDTKLDIQLPDSWDAGMITQLCQAMFGVGIESTTMRTAVIIHPRPRALTEAELAQLETALRAAKPFLLRVDKTTITAGGEDYAVVTVESVGDSVDVLVRDQRVTVPLEDGVGTFHITSQYPTLEPITVRAADQLIYGFEQVEVEAI